MDIISIANKIESKIAESERIRASIRERIEASAKATAQYDKSIALTMIKLSAGQVLQIEDEGQVYETGKVIASNLDKIAKGVCYKQLLDKETAEALLKSAIENLRAVQAELNGWQSVFRFLSEK
jgi:hypothetical protein